MGDPELAARAERAAVRLERSWDRWRRRNGLTAEQPQPISSYVGYSLAEPWGRPRVVFGLAAQEAEQLSALLEESERAASEASQAGTRGRVPRDQPDQARQGSVPGGPPPARREHDDRQAAARRPALPGSAAGAVRPPAGVVRPPAGAVRPPAPRETPARQAAMPVRQQAAPAPGEQRQPREWARHGGGPGQAGRWPAQPDRPAPAASARQAPDRGPGTAADSDAADTADWLRLA